MIDVVYTVVGAWLVGAPSNEITFPVLTGNAQALWVFDRVDFHCARIGDRVEIGRGGYLEKFQDDGWVQWRFVSAPLVRKDEPQPLRSAVRRISALRRAPPKARPADTQA